MTSKIIASVRIERTLELLGAREERVLFLGSPSHGLIDSLCGLGYSNLYVLERRKNIYDGPHNKRVRYVFGDPEQTHFPNDFFGVVSVPDTANYRAGAIVPEARRLLADGGALLFSDGTHETVEKDVRMHPGDVDVLLRLGGQGGITEYSRVMRFRMEREWGVTAKIRTARQDVTAQDVVVEFENGLPSAERIITDALDLASSGNSVYFDVHSAFSDFGVWNGYLPELESRTTMLYRANEIAEADGVGRYTLFPHLSYKNVPELSPRRVAFKLGSFGFASRGKKHEELIRMARRLRIPLTLLLSVNTEVSERVADDMRDYIASLQRLGGGEVEILGGFFSYEEIEERLADCSHLIFTTQNALSNSGSMQFAKRLNKPILSLQTFQAQQAQVHQFDRLIDSRTAVGMQLMTLSQRALYLVRRRPEVASRILRSLFSDERSVVVRGLGLQILRDLYRAASPGRAPLTRSFIDAHRELSRDEDGLEYLYHALRFRDREVAGAPRALARTPRAHKG